VASGAFIFAVSKNIYAGFLCAFVGVFLDIDHLIDYYRDYGINFDIKKFFQTCDEINLKKVTIILHSLELLIVSSILVCFFQPSSWWIKAVYIGFFQHMLLDLFYNLHRPQVYFILYRMNKDFAGKEVWGQGRKLKHHSG
jgi:hypothetical protein